MLNEQNVDVLKKFIDEMQEIANIRYECSIREIETIKKFLVEMKADNPELLHPMFSKHPR